MKFVVDSLRNVNTNLTDQANLNVVANRLCTPELLTEPLSQTAIILAITHLTLIRRQCYKIAYDNYLFEIPQIRDFWIARSVEVQQAVDLLLTQLSP